MRVSGAPNDHEQALVAAAQRHGKAVLVGPVFDTMKRVEDGLVVETIDRDKLRWPVAWAYRPDYAPSSEPPPADWFVGASVLESSHG